MTQIDDLMQKIAAQPNELGDVSNAEISLALSGIVCAQDMLTGGGGTRESLDNLLSNLALAASIFGRVNAARELS